MAQSVQLSAVPGVPSMAVVHPPTRGALHGGGPLPARGSPPRQQPPTPHGVPPLHAVPSTVADTPLHMQRPPWRQPPPCGAPHGSSPPLSMAVAPHPARSALHRGSHCPAGGAFTSLSSSLLFLFILPKRRPCLTNTGFRCLLGISMTHRHFVLKIIKAPTAQKKYVRK